MKRLTSSILLIAFCYFSAFQNNVFAQDNEQDTAYIFESVVKVPATSVKDQHRSGTCWSFAGISFLESEALRITGQEVDISEMYVVRQAYSDKAVKYVRLHGSSNFGPGGQGHDVLNVARDYGLLPENIYPGLEIGEEKHNHGEMDAVLKGILDGVVKRRGGKITPVWLEAYNAVLDAYLGTVPERFTLEGEDFTPKEYAESLGIDPDDYIEITSYQSYPFYEKVLLEIPDNWSDDFYYNVPLDDLMEVFEYALNNGYSICWDGDVSDRGFSHKNGLAILPEKDIESLSGTERSRWENLSESEKNNELYNFEKPGDEKEVDQESRQENFDNYSATDDHLMHLTGIVKDQNGTLYYITKNSWDDDSNDNGGLLNMSEAYARMNTIAIMIHKDAVPPGLSQKLDLK
jgi:bleomycin hydrolase